MAITRRRFLETATATSVATARLAGANHKLPHRKLGKTGAEVPILAMGCGSRFLAYKDEDKSLEALNKAIDSGITYLDTAFGYGNGESETKVGKLMKTRRNDVFLATKINIREPEEAKRTLEGSFKRLQTDRIDLIHIHSLANEDDLAKVEAKGGVLDILRGLRDQKACRFIGVTSHTNPEVLAKALERHDFDCTQMALNAALMGRAKFAPAGSYAADFKPSFETLALPVANKKKLGVIAMKIFAQEDLVGAAPVEKLLQYSWSLPVSACVVGMPKLEFIQQNAELARTFKPMNKREMRDISNKLSAEKKFAIDMRFADHIDA